MQQLAPAQGPVAPLAFAAAVKGEQASGKRQGSSSGSITYDLTQAGESQSKQAPPAAPSDLRLVFNMLSSQRPSAGWLTGTTEFRLSPASRVRCYYLLWKCFCWQVHFMMLMLVILCVLL